MTTLRFVVLCIALFTGVANAHRYNRYRPTSLPEGAQLGDSCTPRGQPRRCGEATLLGQTETELNEIDGIEGLVYTISYTCMHAWYIICIHNKKIMSILQLCRPNVCRVSKMYMQQTRSYTYQEFCYRNRFGGRRLCL